MNSYNRVSNLFVHTSEGMKMRKSKLLKGHINPIPLGATRRTDIKSDKDKINGFLHTFSTLDLETMDWNGEQMPISISISSIRANKRIVSDFFIIDSTKLVYESDGLPSAVTLNLAIDNMWTEFFDFLASKRHASYRTIFVHNLGSFDGIFIFKYLCKLVKNYIPSIMIDGSNNFIKITSFIGKGLDPVTWIDSIEYFRLV